MRGPEGDAHDVLLRSQDTLSRSRFVLEQEEKGE